MTRILHDEEIEGIYNMAPDNYAGIVDLAPNKLYLPLPVFHYFGYFMDFMAYTLNES